MSFRRLVLAAAGTSALLAAAAGAQAQTVPQTYGRVVAFGDSLTDPGNLPPAQQPPAPYFGGRFSNGPVWVEQLGFTVGKIPATTGSVSYAFGGARTDTGPNPFGGPGLRTQFTTFLGAGGTFGPNDLVVLWGGANNIFQASAGPSPATAVPLAIATAATDMAFLVGASSAAGARTVLVANLPDLGKTAQSVAAGPVAAAQASQAGGSFNAALATAVGAAAAASPQTNVILMDVARGFDAIIANPALFGLTNVTQTCFTGVSVCATPSTYLFWDGVHPTAAGHALTARLATDYLTYGARGASATLLGETGLIHRSRSLDGVLEGLRGDAPAEGLAFEIDGGRTDLDARGFVADAELDTVGGRMKASYVFSETFVGSAAIGYARSVGRAGAYKFALDSYGADAALGWRGGAWFVNGAVGFSFDDVTDVQRVSTLGLAHDAKTDGWSAGAQVEAGLRHDLGGMTFTPRVGLAALRSSMDGYSEDGAAARHRVGEREITAVAAEIVARLDAPLGGLAAFGEVGYRDYLSYDADAVAVGLVNNPAQTLGTEIDAADGSAALVNFGLSGRLRENLDIEFGYRGRYGDEIESHQGRVGLTLTF